MGALLFGKSMGSVRKMIMGAALLACSYLVTDTLVLWVGGALLTAALIMWKD